MQGWRTLVANALAAVLAWVNSSFGIVELDPATQGATVVTIMAAMNMGLRMITKTPVGTTE